MACALSVSALADFDGNCLLAHAASLDNTLRLWSVSRGTGECQAVLRAPGQQLSDARALSGGTYAACCNEDGKTYLMDMTHSQCLEEFVLPSLDSHSVHGFEGVATMGALFVLGMSVRVSVSVGVSVSI